MENIDLVITYVDSSDKNWQELYLKYAPQSDDPQVNGEQRFRSNSNFVYLFRGIDKFVPWINKVFLVVQSNSQVPKWINRNNVRVVLHEEFIPCEYLPLFNSQAIEMFLHKIPGLSEKFLYANDDNYFVGKLDKEDFFEDDKIKTSFTKSRLNLDSYDNMPLWKISILNSSLLVNRQETEELKKENTYIAPMHGIRPYLKSKIEEVHDKYGETILNSISKFRDEKNLTIYVFDFYLRAKGLTKEKKYKFSYFSSLHSVSLVCTAIINPELYKTICINDTDESEDEERIKLIKMHFESQFSRRSKFEC